MRCRSCDCSLSDFESTRKDVNGEYIDMCNGCFHQSDVNYMVIERGDLAEYDDNGDEVFDNVFTEEQI